MVGTALQVQSPQINTPGAFEAGQEGARAADSYKIKRASEVMQYIGAGAMHALGGDLNGQADPARYAEVMEGLSSMGLPIPDEVKNNPGFANAAARASMSTLQQLQNARSDQELEMALRKFEADLAQGAAPTADMRNYQFAQENEGFADFMNPPKQGQVIEIYDEETHQPMKATWDGVNPESIRPLGGPKSPAGMVPYTDPETGITSMISNTAAKPPRESELRNRSLLTVVKPELDSLFGSPGQPGTFDALANGWDRAKDFVTRGSPNAVPFGLTATPPDYQKAKSSLGVIAQSYLYSMSGAAAPAAEVDKVVNSVMPQIGESSEAIAAKKARIKTMVEAIANTANLPGGSAADEIDPRDLGGAPGADIDSLLEKYR